MKYLISLSLAALPAISFSSADTGTAGVQLVQISDGFDPEARYMAACFACHSTGAAGAPRVGPGNAGEWAPRLEEKGLDAIVESTVTGIGTMPPKGLCFDCTPEELRVIVEFMLESSE